MAKVASGDQCAILMILNGSEFAFRVELTGNIGKDRKLVQAKVHHALAVLYYPDLAATMGLSVHTIPDGT